MNPLPPPGTFAEGQRLVYGLLAAAAGMFCGACAVATIALLMWGGWSAAEEHSIVAIFGWSLGGFIVAMVVVIVGTMKPPGDQPKIATMLCSSAADQPPHMRS